MKKMELPKIDVVKYVGEDTMIENAVVVNTKFGLALKVESAVIPLKDGDELPKDKHLRASLMMSFAEVDGEQCVGVDTRLDKFMISKNVKPEDLPDKVEDGNIIESFLGKNCKVQLNAKTGFLDLL